MAIRSVPLFLLWLALASTHCASTDDEMCPPGDDRPCQGADGCSGSQRCTGAPAEWSVCECSGGESRSEDTLGATCATDEDCPEGATCLREDGDDLFGGGPPRGMCVVECSELPEECERFGAVCVRTSEDPDISRAFCFPACAPGQAQLEKCHDRTDLACEPLSSNSGEGFCRPFCMQDGECWGGVCDRRRGVCSATGPSGGGFGQPCSPNAESSECAGLCLDLGGGYAVCSHRCTYGSIESCTDVDEARGFCLFSALGGAVGDVGYCAPVCDCNDECAHPQSGCDAFSRDAVRGLLNASGVCAPVDEASEALACVE